MSESELYWVTGGTGFIGRHLVARLQASGRRVIAFSRSDQATSVAFAEENFHTVLRTEGVPRTIFHLAGGASVAASVASPEDDFENTFRTTQRICDWIWRFSPKSSIVFASSAAVYGDQKANLLNEDLISVPCSPYGNHKRQAEVEIQSQGVSHGLNSAIVRLFSVYGPGLEKQLLWDISKRLAANPAVLKLGGDGTETRDFLYIDDAVTILLKASDITSPSGPIVNGGTGIASSVRQIANLLLRMWGSEAALEFDGKRRVGDPHSIVADTQFLSSLFNPELSTKFEDGLVKTVHWHKAQFGI